MADLESLPKLLSNVVEPTKTLYETSNTLLTELKTLDSNVADYIGDFILYNNVKVLSKPLRGMVTILNIIFRKIDKLPPYISLFWYKQIINNFKTVLTQIQDLNKTHFKPISESIGSLSNAYLAYNINTTPAYSYTNDDIRPNFYVPGNTFNKIHYKNYANLITASKYIDAVFYHNLAPTPSENDTCLIQSNSVSISEYSNLYTKTLHAQLTHGDNLVTDVDAINQIETVKTELRKEINLIYEKTHKIINALKNRSLIHTTTPRTAKNITFNIVAGVNINNDTLIHETVDLTQQPYQDFDKGYVINDFLS